jgi:hypothetical protein
MLRNFNGNPEGEGLLTMKRYVLEGNRVDLTSTACKDVKWINCPRILSSSCKQSSKLSGSIKCQDIHDWLNTCQLIVKETFLV